MAVFQIQGGGRDGETADFAGVFALFMYQRCLGLRCHLTEPFSFSVFFGWSALAAGSLARSFFSQNHLYSTLEVREEHEIAETVEAALRGGPRRFRVGNVIENF